MSKKSKLQKRFETVANFAAILGATGRILWGAWKFAGVQEQRKIAQEQRNIIYRAENMEINGLSVSFPAAKKVKIDGVLYDFNNGLAFSGGEVFGLPPFMGVTEENTIPLSQVNSELLTGLMTMARDAILTRQEKDEHIMPHMLETFKFLDTWLEERANLEQQLSQTAPETPAAPPAHPSYGG